MADAPVIIKMEDDLVEKKTSGNYQPNPNIDRTEEMNSPDINNPAYPISDDDDINDGVRGAGRKDDYDDDDDDEEEEIDDVKVAGSVAGHSHGTSSNSSFSLLAYLGYWRNVVLESSVMRATRRILISARFDMIFKTFCFVGILIATLLSTTYVTTWELSSIKIYNIVQILAGFLGYFLLLAASSFCITMHKSIIATRMNSSEGNMMADLESSWFWDNVPGSQVRLFLMVLTLLIEIMLMAATYNFEFIPTSDFISKGSCVPLTYPTPISPIDNLGDFLQGYVDPSLAYEYLLPLGDGGLGGFAAWPNVNPGLVFSMAGHGYIYAISTHCFAETSAPTSYNGTKFFLTNLEQFANFVEGEVQIYMPTGSSTSTLDTGKGILQVCTFIVGFGRAVIEVEYWEMVAPQTIESIKFDNVPIITKYSSSSRFYEEFASQMDASGDNYGLSPQYAAILPTVLNSSLTYESTQGGTFCNLLSWATLPDGFYYTNITAQGLTLAIGAVAHYMLFQYNGTASGSCNYYGFQGAGTIVSLGPWLSVIQILVYISLAILFLAVSWVYLVHPLGLEDDMVYPSLWSPVFFAHSLRHHINELLGNSPSATFETLPGDIMKKCGDSKIYFGVQKETIEQGLYKLAFGGKREVISIHKVVKMQRRMNRRKAE